MERGNDYHRKPFSDGPGGPQIIDPVGRLLTINDVIEEVRLSRAMIYRSMKVRDNPFPKPIKFGKASRWSFVEVVEWKKRAVEMRGNVGQVWKTIL